MDEIFVAHAAEMEEAERASSIRLASSKAFPDKLLNPDQYIALDCVDCDLEIPEFRKQRGCIRCVYCQERVEKRQ